MYTLNRQRRVLTPQRIQTTEFNAEQALTRDTVPTNIDAILFWQVHDAERAALEIADHRQVILRRPRSATSRGSSMKCWRGAWAGGCCCRPIAGCLADGIDVR